MNNGSRVGGMLSWIESYDRFIAFSLHAVVSRQVNFFYRRGQREKVACRIYKLFKQILFQHDKVNSIMLTHLVYLATEPLKVFKLTLHGESNYNSHIAENTSFTCFLCKLHESLIYVFGIKNTHANKLAVRKKLLWEKCFPVFVSKIILSF